MSGAWSRRRGFSEDLITAYVDDELDAQGRAEVERELARSPELRAVLDDIELVRALVRALPARDLDAETWRRIHGVVASAGAVAAPRPSVADRFTRRSPSTRLTLAGAAVAAAAAVIVVVAVLVPAQRVTPDVASLARASALGVSSAEKAQAPDHPTADAAGRSEAAAPQATTPTTTPATAPTTPTRGKWRYLDQRSAPEGAVQNRYTNGVDAASVFVRDGAVDWGALPHGRGVKVADHRARAVDVTAVAVAVVWEDGGSVFTCVGVAPEAVLLRLARAFASGRIAGAEDDGLVGFLLGPFRWR